jgi:hypothetical protein
MEPTDLSLLAELPRLIALAIGVSAGVAAAVIYYRRQPATVRSAPGTPIGLVYNDTPTVRMVDSQRVDRLRKVVRLAAGEHVDVLETRAAMPPRFRVTLKAIERRAEPMVQLVVSFGGATVSCGPLVQEIGFNEFLLPRAQRDEPRSSVFHYHESGDSLDFMRLKIRSIDADANTAELDVMQVSGHWPARDA